MLVKIETEKGSEFVNPAWVVKVRSTEDGVVIEMKGQDDVLTTEPMESVASRLNYATDLPRDYSDRGPPPPPKPFD